MDLEMHVRTQNSVYWIRWVEKWGRYTLTKVADSEGHPVMADTLEGTKVVLNSKRQLELWDDQQIRIMTSKIEKIY